jgi:hypothetical protein
MSTVWIDYFSGQTDLTEKFPARVASVNLEDLLSDITTTDILGGEPISTGNYRINGFLYLQRADSIAAGIDLTWTFTFNGISRILTASLPTTNDPQSALLPFCYPVRISANSAVSYATQTAFSGGDALYGFTAWLEECEA